MDLTPISCGEQSGWGPDQGRRALRKAPIMDVASAPEGPRSRHSAGSLHSRTPTVVNCFPADTGDGLPTNTTWLQTESARKPYG